MSGYYILTGLLLGLQAGCSIALIVTRNNLWLVGSAGLILPNLLLFILILIKAGRHNVGR